MNNYKKIPPQDFQEEISYGGGSRAGMLPAEGVVYVGKDLVPMSDSTYKAIMAVIDMRNELKTNSVERDTTHRTTQFIDSLNNTFEIKPNNHSNDYKSNVEEPVYIRVNNNEESLTSSQSIGLSLIQIKELREVLDNIIQYIES